MKILEQNFNTRQRMVTADFEFFHYLDKSVLNVEYHNHEFYEVYLFISGKVTYIIEGKSYMLRPGDIVLINNKELHNPVIEPGEPYERIVIWLDPNYIKQQSTDGTNLLMCFESSSKNRYNLLRPRAEIAEYIRNIAEKIGNECSNISYGSNILKNILIAKNILHVLNNRNELSKQVDNAYNYALKNLFSINDCFCI